jgi:hypothetical protein
MLRLFYRAALLGLPFLLLGVFVAAVDPFDYFGVTRFVGDGPKMMTALRLHYPLWKIHQFERIPADRILLGDSRMNAFTPATIQALTGDSYFNFAYAGGTLTEAVETYWLAAKVVHLKAVYLEAGLINFNAYQSLNRIPDVSRMDANPLLYLTDRVVLRSAVLAAYASWTGNPVKIEAPSLDRDAFWRFQIDESMPQLLHRYAYPDSVAKQLRDIAADCKRNGTRFVVVIPPTHVDAQTKIASLGLSADNERFKEFARSLGEVFDFDWANDFTSDRANFSDPLHVRESDSLIREIWSADHAHAHARHTP